MANTPDASALPLPPGFHTIEEIKNMPSERVRAENFFNVIGFVKDFQAPMKCQKGTSAWCLTSLLWTYIADCPQIIYVQLKF